MADNPVQILGGQNVVGGTKIYYRLGPTAGLFFDFGYNFELARALLDQYLSPRTFSLFADCLQAGFLPQPTAKTGNFYRADLIAQCHQWQPWLVDTPAFSKPNAVKGLLLSHAHADHCGDIWALDPSIPLICTPATHAVLEIYEITHPGRTYFTSILGYSPEGSKDTVTRKVKVVESGVPWAWGKPLEVTAWETDHTLPGAAAFCIDNKKRGEKIIYSGDLRWHGLYSGRVDAFVEAAAEFEPDYLLIEQTNLDGGKEYSEGDGGGPGDGGGMLTEAQVGDQIAEVAAEAGGNVWVEWMRTDLSRLQGVYRAAMQSRREVVVTPQIYLYVRECMARGIAEAEGFSLESMRVLLARKRSGEFAPKDYSYDTALYELLKTDDPERLKERGKYKHMDFDKPFLLKPADIAAQPGKFILYHDVFQMFNWVDAPPGDGDVYIISKSKIDEPEAELSWEKRAHWLELFGFTKGRVRHIHASGHLYPQDYERMVEAINAKHIVGIHGG